PRSTLFPYTTLFRSQREPVPDAIEVGLPLIRGKGPPQDLDPNEIERRLRGLRRGFRDRIKASQGSPHLAHKRLKAPLQKLLSRLDRKSTRLNSSHVK